MDGEFTSTNSKMQENFAVLSLPRNPRKRQKIAKKVDLRGNHGKTKEGEN
jgi:hypothetical protein